VVGCPRTERAGDVDDCALLAEHERNAFAAAPARTGHERYAVLQAWLGHGSLGQKVFQVPDDEPRLGQCFGMTPER